MSLNWIQWDNGCWLFGHGKCLEWDKIVHDKFDEIVKLERWFSPSSNSIKFSKYSCIVLLSEFNDLISLWIVNNVHISFG